MCTLFESATSITMSQPAPVDALVETPDADVHHSFLFEHMPDGPQATICSLANTPSCPGHVLLAAVSKCWSAVALQHLAATGASIILSLACTGSSSTEDNTRETDRLSSLKAWLQRFGHTLSSLWLDPSAGVLRPFEFVPGRGQGVSGILEALAAAGTRSAGLRLQQLQLPAIGCATPASIARALSGCQGLRQLQLDYTYSADAMEPPEYTQGLLPAALQQLTQLTSLRLNLGGLQRPPAAGAAHPVHEVTMDHLFHSLPSSLEVLDVAVSSTCRVALDQSWASLQRMVALRQLILPRDLWFSRSNDGHQLTPLTSVTYLDYENSVQYSWELLRALPNIVELWGGFFENSHQSAVLNTLTALKSLGCMLDGSAESAAILAELTQLTSLALWMGFAGAEWVVRPDAYGHAVGLMTGLRSLTIEPEMLELADATALTALTRLELSMAREEWDDQYTPERLQQMLQRVAPARGQLREVQMVGLDASQHGLYRAAVTVALGDVPLVFAATCGRPVWCMCCPSRLRQV